VSLLFPSLSAIPAGQLVDFADEIPMAVGCVGSAVFLRLITTFFHSLGKSPLVNHFITIFFGYFNGHSMNFYGVNHHSVGERPPAVRSFRCPPGRRAGLKTSAADAQPTMISQEFPASGMMGIMIGDPNHSLILGINEWFNVFKC
jgi:hypothetical protein